MELREINAFLQVAQFKSFSKAARHLGYSQAAITIQIKQLEQELDVHLFDRIGKQISLTRDGELFFKHANTIMQELLIRGYLYQLIKAQYSTAAAAIATTALFTFLHGGALEAGIIPTLNVVTMSLLMGLVLEYTQSLLAPMVMHFLWNCIGGILLGGVSLAEDYPQLCRTEFTGPVLLSGGAPKMEGSIVVFLLNLLLIAVFAALLKKRKQ